MTFTFTANTRYRIASRNSFNVLNTFCSIWPSVVYTVNLILGSLFGVLFTVRKQLCSMLLRILTIRFAASLVKLTSLSSTKSFCNQNSASKNGLLALYSFIGLGMLLFPLRIVSHQICLKPILSPRKPTEKYQFRKKLFDQK